MLSEVSIRAAMLKLAANFPATVDLDATLGGVTAAAVELMDGVDYADVMLISEGQFRSVRPTAELVIALDTAQMQLQEGPCLAAAVAESMIRCPDLRVDDRWPNFAAAAVAAGIHSMLSFQLYKSDNGAAGALNLFGRNKSEFDPETEAIGAMLATHAAVAVIAANEHDQLQSALASRDIIGQAKGILMERFTIDAVAAFAMLTKLSQNSNTPLRILAARMADTAGT